MADITHESGWQARLHGVTRINWLVWLLLTAVLLHLLMMGSLFWGYLNPLSYQTHRAGQALDFFSIYEAGHKALLNRSFYDSALGDTMVRTPYHSSYRYVPVFAYGFGVPANALPPWPAYWGWVAFNELLLVVNAYATWRVAGKSSWGVVGAAMWFVFTPIYVEFYDGQFSFLMATFVLWMGIGLLRQKELLTGASWALSLVTKSNTVLVAPMLFRIGWWRALVLGAAVAAVNLPYFIWRPADLEFFWRASVNDSLTHPIFRPMLYTPANHGLLSFFNNAYLASHSAAVDVSHALPLVLTFVIIGSSLAVTFLARRADPLLLLATWVTAFFLFDGWVPEYHYVMLLPVLVLLVGHRPGLRIPALAVFVALALPTPYWLLNHVWNTSAVPPPSMLDPVQLSWPAWGVVFYHAAKSLPTLALWSYLVAVQCRGGTHGRTLRTSPDIGPRAGTV
jgi:hypothetical protein